MDEWISSQSPAGTDIPPVDLANLIISLLLSFVLSFVLANVYIRTHRGVSYSRSFSHTIVFIAITIDLIMIIIGSNIARAFALVGAMSIVRFRNPIKDSRDLIFIFMSMAIGMATGTQFYLFSIVFTGFALVVIYAFDHLDFGSLPGRTLILRVHMPENAMDAVRNACAESCRRVSVISIDRSASRPEYQEVVFELETAKATSQDDIIAGIANISDDISVNLLVGESSISV
jgi:uncharacterized membrane protein YhiD involved in acid resistance